jgi:hypothetical protein
MECAAKEKLEVLWQSSETGVLSFVGAFQLHEHRFGTQLLPKGKENVEGNS